MIEHEVGWWKDSCRTFDKQDYNYSAIESLSPSGTSVRITFDEFGTFSSYSEEAAIKVFQDWYKQNVKACKHDLRDPVRQPPVRDGNRKIG